MFSKQKLPPLGQSQDRCIRREPRSFAQEVAAVAKAMLPESIQDGCIPKVKLAQRCVAAAPAIRTTVTDGVRRESSSGQAPADAAFFGECPAAPRRAPGIRTTVSDPRFRRARCAAPDAVVAPMVAAEDCVAGDVATCSSSSSQPGKRKWDDCAKPDEDTAQLAPWKPQLRAGDASCRYELARYATELAAPTLGLVAVGSLQLSSPWAGLAMAGAPFAGAPPSITQAQQMAMNMQQLQQEEDQFMSLIFPGFDAGSFIWQITCWQAVEFVLSMIMGHKGANPLPCVLYRLGASWGPALARGQVWRLISPVMLHANLTHLLFNVFFQLRMGFGMERQFGRTKMMLLYFACGVVGNLVSVSIDPYKLAVGASTAGFGLIGVWVAEILLSWEILGPARERTMIWIAFMLISVTTMSTMTPNMDLWGHLGGALGGFLLSIIISDMREQDRPAWYSQARAAAVVALALLIAGGVAKGVAFTPKDPIPDCPMLPGMDLQLPPQLTRLLATQ